MTTVQWSRQTIADIGRVEATEKQERAPRASTTLLPSVCLVHSCVSLLRQRSREPASREELHAAMHEDRTWMPALCVETRNIGRAQNSGRHDGQRGAGTEIAPSDTDDSVLGKNAADVLPTFCRPCGSLEEHRSRRLTAPGPHKQERASPRREHRRGEDAELCFCGQARRLEGQIGDEQ